MYKIIKKLSFFLILTSVIVSCEDAEEVIYEGGVNDQAFISLNQQTYDLPVNVDSEGTGTLTLESSALRDFDRTFTITVDEENTTANPNLYSLPTQATIPAGEYSTNIIVTGYDIDLEEGVTEILSVDIENITDNSSTGISNASINIFQVCPIPSDRYTGTWNVTTSGCQGDGNGGCADNGQFSGLQATVEISPAESEEGVIIGFEISDITGGLYSVGYGAAGSVATVQENCLNLSFTDQPDTTYGGDVFNGSGFAELDANGDLVSFTIEWSNGYGDAGTSVYTPAN